MSEEEINKLVKEHYGFTIDDMDESIGIWMTRFSKEREKRLQLKSVLKEIRELLGHFECGQVCECTQELAIHVLEIIDKGIGE